MGAAGSVKAVYLDAAKWFRSYFDSDMYLQDFELIDKNNDGGITYEEIKAWVLRKSEEEGGSWQIFLTHPQVLQYAHSLAAKRYGELFARSEKKLQFTISDFRTLLVQYFAISMLWVHFENSEEHSGEKDLALTFEEFKVAVQTFCETHEREAVTEEQMRVDFTAMDADKSGNLAFIEVCDYCCRFMDPHSALISEKSTVDPETAAKLQDRARQELLNEKESMSALHQQQMQQVLVPSELHATLGSAAGSDDGAQGMRGVVLQTSSADSVQSKTTAAVDQLAEDVQKERVQAKLAEIRVETNREITDLLS